jgi:hypothetical protein
MKGIFTERTVDECGNKTNETRYARFSLFIILEYLILQFYQDSYL